MGSSAEIGRRRRKLLRRLEKSLLWLGFGRWQLPHFMVIGAQKAGTTWLHQNLACHPEVFVPGMKELHYFNSSLERTMFGYARYFTRAGRRTIGETTPAYSVLPEDDIRFLHSILPRLRLVLLLREPRERAWSHAVMEEATRKRRRVEDVPVQEFRDFLASPACFERSNYPLMMDRWQGVFGEEALHVDFFDHIKSEPEALLNRVFDHIGVTAVTDWTPFPVRRVVAPVVEKTALDARRIAGGFVVDDLKPEEKKTPRPPAEIAAFLDELHGPTLDQLRQRFGKALPCWDGLEGGAQG